MSDKETGASKRPRDHDQYEREHVHEVYEAIADHFSSTRYKPWPRVVDFLSRLPPHAVVVDVGCGNGKYFAAASHSGRWVMGFDYSHALLQRTQRDWVDPNVGEAVPPTEALPVTDVLCADGRRCPLRDGMADAAISIAVIHHYSTPERRKEAIQELLRVVKPDGGLALIYVWAVEEEEQTNRDGGKRKKSKKRAMDKDTGDALVRWEVHEKFDQEKKVYQRYYHFFKKGELEALALEAAREMKSACTVKESYFDRENWCILLERH